MDVPKSKLAVLASAVFLLLTIVFRTFLAQDDDPYRCQATLNSGRWADPADEEGNRLPFKKWEPDSCVFHQYTSEDIRQCFQGRHVVFSGDPTARQIAYGLGRLLERDEALWQQGHMEGNDDHTFNLTYHGVQIQSLWNPSLKIEAEDDSNDFADQLQILFHERENPVPVDQQEAAALIMLSANAAFVKKDVQDPAGNLDSSLSAISSAVGTKKDWTREPMDFYDGIGNQVFYAPPAGPSASGDEQVAANVRAIQDHLTSVDVAQFNVDLAWAISAVVEDQDKTFAVPTTTGFEVLDIVAETKANILLNLRCNAVLDRLKGYPYNRTCCSDYGPKPFVQICVVTAAVLYLAACVVGEAMDLMARRTTPRFPWFSMDVGTFVMAIVLCYFADRTHLFAKGMKHFTYADFFYLVAPCVLLAAGTFRKSTPPRAKPNAPNVVPDQPFLSRDQTEEWKGWMQAAILIYHWVHGTESAAIYIFVRLLVAAYLFQTGYGHTTFFLLKKDFGFKRVCSVLLRLNLLPCALAYMMNTDYMFYYFSPLCSFWFMVVYFTLWVAHARCNDDTQLVVAKICCSAVLVAGLVLATPVNRWAFDILRLVFNIQWSIKEWEFRVALDLFVVYVGMLTAVAYLKMKEEMKPMLRYSMALFGFAVMTGYSYACKNHMTDVADYKQWHPYISAIPILAFIAVRNVSGPVRNYYSTAMAWLGKCSLETYTLQFHIFLASDTTNLLLVDGLTGGGDGTLLGDRWRSLVIVVPMFLLLSSVTATSTGNLVKLIMSTSPPADGADAEKDAETYSDDPNSGLLGRSKSTVSKAMKYLPTTKSVMYSLHARIVLILLVMWALNVLTPVLDDTVPDGWTPQNAAEEAAKAAAAHPTAI